MKKKQLLVMVSMMLVVAMVSVAGTLAFLIDDTEAVVNTFSAGNVTIDLDETDVDVYGVKDGDTPVKKNDYKLIPGHTYTKDPTVHVATGSEECWVYVRVENAIENIEANGDGIDTIAEQMEELGWVAVDGETNVFYHEETHTAGDDVPVFESFTIAGDADVADYVGDTIVITGYAVQVDSFEDDAQGAWDATFGA